MSDWVFHPRAEIEAKAQEAGIEVDWELIDPVLDADGNWELARTVAQNARSAELEFGWAIDDQVNASSSGYYPRGMDRGARMTYGAAMHGRAQGRLERAEAKRRAAEALAKVLAAMEDNSDDQ